MCFEQKRKGWVYFRLRNLPKNQTELKFPHDRTARLWALKTCCFLYIYYSIWNVDEQQTIIGDYFSSLALCFLSVLMFASLSGINYWTNHQPNDSSPLEPETVLLFLWSIRWFKIFKMVFPKAVQDETLAPQFGVGMWGTCAWDSAELRYQCYCVCFSSLNTPGRPPSSTAHWPAVQSKLTQPDSSVQAGSREQGSRGCCKSFPSQRAAQERLFLEALRCRDFALSSLSLRVCFYIWFIYGFYYPLSFMHDLNRQKVRL